MKKLSIIIPAYNEEPTLAKILEKVLAVPLSLEKEIIIVNDGSTDRTGEIAKQYEKKYSNIHYFEKENAGKGSAVRVGFQQASGDIFIVQDADLEYDPHDYEACITPILKKKTKVVYGSRRLNKENKKYSGLIYYLGADFLNFVTNILYGGKLTDMYTCYKTYHHSVFKKYMFRHNRFHWEPEITAHLLKQNYTIIEVPISYYPRKSTEGKKIGLRDFFDGLFTLFRERF